MIGVIIITNVSIVEPSVTPQREGATVMAAYRILIGRILRIVDTTTLGKIVNGISKFLAKFIQLVETTLREKLIKVIGTG